MSEVVAGGELPKGSFEEVVIFRRTREATVDHTEKERIGPAQRDLKPQCITKRCRSGIREDNRDWQGRICGDGAVATNQTLLMWFISGVYTCTSVFGPLRLQLFYHRLFLSSFLLTTTCKKIELKMPRPERLAEVFLV
ncbi:hypothetical protein CLF_108244 [Clonorchis sinensis]|uniref:Uncharacterized protein n=1 Tax=Clonorchis sinensis TaxID=79923 RepID=G7YHT2_CLOSI|nr:hypothetical protein CLF_108244 [Clonorchis sinensis]